MNVIEAYHFGAWEAIDQGIKKGYLDEKEMNCYKNRLMKMICMEVES